MTPTIKNVTPINNTQSPPIFPIGESHLKRQPPIQFVKSFESNLKVTNRITNKSPKFMKGNTPCIKKSNINSYEQNMYISAVKIMKNLYVIRS